MKKVKRPATRAEIPDRLKRELNNAQHLLTTLIHEFTVIGADEALDAKTANQLSEGADTLLKLREQLFDLADRRAFLLKTSKRGSRKVLALHVWE